MRYTWQHQPESPWPERAFYLLCGGILLGLLASLAVVVWFFGVLLEWWPLVAR